MFTSSKSNDPPITAPVPPTPTSDQGVITPSRIRLTGTHQPKFRGDTPTGLLIGTLWSFAVGFIGLLMGLSAPHFVPILAFTAICWASSLFLLRRWSIFRFGSAVLLQPDGFAQFPITRNPLLLHPWKPGLEISFTHNKSAWTLQIRDGLRTRVDILFPSLTDPDIESIRTVLTQWQPNRIFVEKL